MTVTARRLDLADEFAARAGAFLLAHEAEHNLALGLLGRLQSEPRLYGAAPVFVVAEEAGEVVGCLLRTPPHATVLSRFADLHAVDAVAAVRDIDPGLPGAVGPVDVAARFAEAWACATGVHTRIAVRQRIHAAHSVRDVSRPGGEMREATPDDAPVVVDRVRSFAAEALGAAARIEDAEATYRRRLEDPHGAWVVWDDGGPVSLAACGNRTPSGTRVGPVYTPPELRGRGYATALVAELTVEQLASGLSFCFLFTDLANPTSNAIYARIGYEPVADWDQWAFEGLEE